MHNTHRQSLILIVRACLVSLGKVFTHTLRLTMYNDHSVTIDCGYLGLSLKFNEEHLMIILPWIECLLWKFAILRKSVDCV